jgi:hypothetical protein
MPEEKKKKIQYFTLYNIIRNTHHLIITKTISFENIFALNFFFCDV